MTPADSLQRWFILQAAGVQRNQPVAGQTSGRRLVAPSDTTSAVAWLRASREGRESVRNGFALICAFGGSRHSTSPWWLTSLAAISQLHVFLPALCWGFCACALCALSAPPAAGTAPSSLPQAPADDARSLQWRVSLASFRHDVFVACACFLVCSSATFCCTNAEAALAA